MRFPVFNKIVFTEFVICMTKSVYCVNNAINHEEKSSQLTGLFGPRGGITRSSASIAQSGALKRYTPYDPSQHISVVSTLALVNRTTQTVSMEPPTKLRLMNPYPDQGDHLHSDNCHTNLSFPRNLFIIHAYGHFFCLFQKKIIIKSAQ